MPVVEIRDFKEFARGLRDGSPMLARDVRRGVRVLAESIMHDAEFILQGVSVAIPPTLRIRTHDLLGVDVVAGGGDATPIAGLLEFGGSKQKGATTWSHPVFGHTDVVVDQATHPYFAPAVKANEDRIEVIMGGILDRVIEFVVTAH